MTRQKELQTEVNAARESMRSRVDPVEPSLSAAPPGDEPETEEECHAVDCALNDPRPGIPLEEILREYGL